MQECGVRRTCCGVPQYVVGEELSPSIPEPTPRLRSIIATCYLRHAACLRVFRESVERHTRDSRPAHGLAHPGQGGCSAVAAAGNAAHHNVEPPAGSAGQAWAPNSLQAGMPDWHRFRCVLRCFSIRWPRCDVACVGHARCHLWLGCIASVLTTLGHTSWHNRHTQHTQPHDMGHFTHMAQLDSTTARTVFLHMPHTVPTFCHTLPHGPYTLPSSHQAHTHGRPSSLPPPLIERSCRWVPREF
eukprot:189762-Chlamydomonas_euryale.AAC.2